jgi:AcrR family transcriptional regulator
MAKPNADKPGKHLRADARDNRVRIVNAARARFASDGLAAEMDAIAADAGVAVGTLYRHFMTKEDLLDEVLQTGFQRLAEFIQNLLREPDAWSGVERLIRHLAERQVSDQAFKDLLAAQPSLRATAIALKRDLAPSIENIVSRAQASGQLRSDVVATDLPMLLAGLPTGPKEARTRQRYLMIMLKGLQSAP